MDRRDDLLEKITREMPEVAAQLSFKKAGRSTIDVTKVGVDKASALKDFFASAKRNPGRSFYFGNEFYEGGNDEPVASDAELQSQGLKVCSVSSEETPELYWLGDGPNVLQEFLGQL